MSSPGGEWTVRVLALWKQLAGYSSECFRHLDAAGVELKVLHRASTSEAPFEDADLGLGLETISWQDDISLNEVTKVLEAFSPDVILVASWDNGSYRRALRRWEGKAVRVLCMDNQWLGTVKQWGGRLISPAIILPSFDLAFVAGERQAQFAKKLGFGHRQIMWGLYCCQQAFFSDPNVRSPGSGFLYAGRLVREKGIDVLAAAYESYRESAASPWPLRVAGTGPLADSLASIDGVDMLGFVNPGRLPELYRAAGCLVLPSRFEPWGVVIHEAAASGIPIVCTDACGASTRLVLDGLNGRVVGPGDVDHLSAALSWITEASIIERRARALASFRLAHQLTPERWAAYVLDRVTDAAERLRTR